MVLRLYILAIALACLVSGCGNHGLSTGPEDGLTPPAAAVDDSQDYEGDTYAPLPPVVYEG